MQNTMKINWQYVEDSSAITDGYQLVTTENFFLIQDMNKNSFYTNCISIHVFVETDRKELLNTLADCFNNKNISESVIVYYGPEVKKVIDQICTNNATYFSHD